MKMLILLKQNQNPKLLNGSVYIHFKLFKNAVK